MIIYIGIMLMGIIGFCLHLWLDKKPKTPLRIIELCLAYQLFFSVGLLSLLAFYGLVFMTEFVADYSGWTPCAFELLLGNVNLAFGVLGILSIWIRGDFWTATIIGMSIWLLADAFTHVRDMIDNQNYSPGNIGVPLYTDILIPFVLLILLAIYKYMRWLDKQQTADGA